MSGAKKIARMAYITSMATGGLAGFNFKEVVELERLGVQLSLFITKYKEGPYMPPASMPLEALSVGKVLRGALAGAPQFLGRLPALVREAAAMGTLGDLGAALRWAPRMRRAGCEWIHCHWGDHKLYIGYFCHRLLGIPLSVTLHGYDIYAPPNWRMLELSLRACRRIITISEYNRKVLRKRLGELADRVEVVRLFTDVTREPGRIRDAVKILIVAGFQDRKGYDILLKAIQGMEGRNVVLWVVGYKGPVNVPQMVKDMNLSEKVTIFGAVSDEVLKVLYTYCDIFCMPSRMDKDGIGEGLPVALMEAMSYEKPIVSTLHTGIPELVPDILVPENDVQGLADALSKLCDDPGLRAGSGTRNRRIVAEAYSQANVRKLLDVLES